MLKKAFRRKLRFEGLEQRALLAVTAGVSGGQLRVNGDNLANDIDIVQTADGEFDVYSSAVQVGPHFTGVTGIKVELKGGDDTLDIEGNNADPLAKNLIIRAGLGDDIVNVGTFVLLGPPSALDVAGYVDIETSDGDDSVTIFPGTDIGGKLTVNTGLDDDFLSVVGEFPVGGEPITVGANMTLKTSRGDDDVIVGGISVTGAADIETSDGIDNVFINPGTDIGGKLAVNTGLQDDSLFLSGDVAGGFPITLGAGATLKTSKGNDSVGLIDVDVTGLTVVETSDGDDIVTVGGISTFSGGFSANTGHGVDDMTIGDGANPVEVGGLLKLDTSVGDDTLVVHLLNTTPVPGTTTIKTSDGEDDVTIRDSEFAILDVNTGLHDDTLFFDPAFPSTVIGKATLNGSGGTGDTLDHSGLTAGTLVIKGFETVIP